MNNEVRNYLIEIARSRKIVYYQELCDSCHLNLDMKNNPTDRKEVGRIIGEISTFEYNNSRPLLSALVLNRVMEEGDGFYKLCENLGLVYDWKRVKKEGTFSLLEIKKCHDFWSDESNYLKYKTK